MGATTIGDILARELREDAPGELEQGDEAPSGEDSSGEEGIQGFREGIHEEVELLTTTRTTSSGSGMIADIPVELILKSPFQPRIELNPMQELSSEEDMKLPLLVRKGNDGQHYELIDGEGRLERLKRLGARVARCEIREMDDEATSVAILRINGERRPLEDVEKARWLSNHMRRFGKSLLQAAADANWDRGTASRLHELAELKGWAGTNEPTSDSTEPVDTINSSQAEERTKSLTQNKLMIINTLPKEKRESVSTLVEQHRVSTADVKVLVAKVKGGMNPAQALTEIGNWKESTKQERHQDRRRKEGKKAALHRNYGLCEECGDRPYFIHAGPHRHKFFEGGG